MNEPAESVLQPEDAKVLVIDDEDSVLTACAEVLRREGFQVRTAHHGEEGLKMVGADPPDIAFIDFKMPGLPGLAVLDEMKHKCPDTVKIVVTAYATVNTALTAMRHGAFDFLAKPFTPDELRIIAGRALEYRRMVLQGCRLAQERDQTKRRFLNLITSEVTDPVRASLGELSRLAECLAGDEPKRTLAQSAAERLNRLLDNVERWEV